MKQITRKRLFIIFFLGVLDPRIHVTYIKTIDEKHILLQQMSRD